MNLLKMPRRYSIEQDAYGYMVKVWLGGRWTQVKFCYSRKQAEDYVIDQRHAGNCYHPPTKEHHD